MKSLYEVLGVRKYSTKAQIKSAYRQLAQTFHPDKNPSDPERFKSINEAYTVLSCDKKRKEHDLALKLSGFQSFSYKDIPRHTTQDYRAKSFNQKKQTKEKTKKDPTVHLSFLLSDLKKSGDLTKQITITRHINCNSCNGVGGTSAMRCIMCDGLGYIQASPGRIGNKNIYECKLCSGQGKIVKGQCLSCHGRGKIKTVERLSLTIGCESSVEKK